MDHWSAPYFIILAVELVGFGLVAWILFRHARRD
jgi:hypothetical protein